MLAKVSVIVPIHNSEKSLPRCLKSILLQSFKNLEIILVNDGSQDNSLEICEKFRQKDNRIIIINKKNSGVSSARNSGLKIASGEFIQFVDADDFLNFNMLECMLKKINENDADIAICGYNKISSKRIIKKSPNNFDTDCLIEFKDCFIDLYKNAFLNAPWNKLYRRQKIKTYFDETLSIGEDLLFNLSYISNCDKISVMDQILYNYDVSLQNSLACQYDEKLFYTQIFLNKEVQNFLKENFNSNDFSEINEVFAKEIYYYLKKLVFLSKGQRKEKIKKIKSCVKNSNVRDMLYNIKLSDFQIKIVCNLMKLKQIKIIYMFFYLKKFINKNGIR